MLVVLGNAVNISLLKFEQPNVALASAYDNFFSPSEYAKGKRMMVYASSFNQSCLCCCLMNNIVESSI